MKAQVFIARSASGLWHYRVTTATRELRGLGYLSESMAKAAAVGTCAALGRAPVFVR